MIGGFQPNAFQPNFQRGAPVPSAGLVWVERPIFNKNGHVIFDQFPRVVFDRFGHSIFGQLPRVRFKSKRIGETVFLKPSFDFISALAPTETLLTAVVVATVYSGVDPNPSAIISGSAAISGTQVTQLVTGGVSGTIYGLVCTVTTSLGQTLNSAGFFSVDPPLV